MWSKWQIFRADVDNRGGLDTVAAQSGLLLTTLTAWYNGTRIPHWISRPGIAVALGFPAQRYS
ncbi:MAG: hypothetical protein AAGU27_26285 [Dehalobacterium sp.]